ncbi:TIR domain-containing protein [Kocuria aegyptia]|uniref:Thoeris protein ThsB TIR-like domain-containing protein n=1 Tax=Kocuria aegyptia TaxID=330943 RepID=A0ABN2KST1_9MICC
MAPKTVFLAFAEQDELFRDLFTTQWARAGDQARFLDALGDGTCPEEWKKHVRERIRDCDGVIALIGGSTPASAAALWQIRCAVTEGKPLLGLWVESEHRWKPDEMGPARCESWTWENIGDFLDRL